MQSYTEKRISYILSITNYNFQVIIALHASVSDSTGATFCRALVFQKLSSLELNLFWELTKHTFKCFWVTSTYNIFTSIMLIWIRRGNQITFTGGKQSEGQSIFLAIPWAACGGTRFWCGFPYIRLELSLSLILFWNLSCCHCVNILRSPMAGELWQNDTLDLWFLHGGDSTRTWSKFPHSLHLGAWLFSSQRQLGVILALFSVLLITDTVMF